MGNTVASSEDGVASSGSSGLCPMTSPQQSKEPEKLPAIQEEEPAPGPLATVLSSVLGTSVSMATEPAFGPGGPGPTASFASRKSAQNDGAGQSPLASMMSSFSSRQSAAPTTNRTNSSVANGRRLASGDPFQTMHASGGWRQRHPSSMSALSEQAPPTQSIASAFSSAFMSSSAAGAGASKPPLSSAQRSVAGSGKNPFSTAGSNATLKSQGGASAMYSNLGGGLFGSKTTMAQALTQQQGTYLVHEAPCEVEEHRSACCC